MYIAEICGDTETGYAIIARVKFKNFRRFNAFMRYYSKKYQCMIRAYRDSLWYETFKNGKDIWNIW